MNGRKGGWLERTHWVPVEPDASEPPSTDLLNMSVVGTVDELLQLCQTIGFGQSEDQLRLDVRLAGLLSSHLQELYQVLPVSCTQPAIRTFSKHHPMRLGFVNTRFYNRGGLTALGSSLSHLHVSGRVIGLDVGVDGFFHHPFLKLGLCQLTPHRGLIAALGKFIRSVQVPDVLNQNLEAKKVQLENDKTWSKFKARNSKVHGAHLHSRGVDVKLSENCERLLEEFITDGNICDVRGVVVVKAIDVLHDASSVGFNGRQNEKVLEVSEIINTFSRLESDTTPLS